MVDHDTFWLATDCTIPGKGWDARCHRIVTWARFRDQTSGSEFFHFNTHFDHLGRRALRESAELLLAKLRAIPAAAPGAGTGDFNCREKSRTHQLLTQRQNGNEDAIAPLRDSLLETAESA